MTYDTHLVQEPQVVHTGVDCCVHDFLLFIDFVIYILL